MRLTAFVVTALLSSSAWADQCVHVTLQDMNGLPIATTKPLIGFVVPDLGPIVDYPVPAGWKLAAGAGVSCPPEVIAAIEVVFKDNCLVDAERKATAKSNNMTDENVNKRCKDIFTALNPKK
jgi:hypothetical protein